MNARPDIPLQTGALHQRPDICAERGLPVHDARTLTGPAGQARIVLDGQVYALRITRAGKLILTK